MEKQVLVKEIFIKGLNMGLPLLAWVRKIVHWVKAYRLKEKIPGKVVSKKGHVGSALDIKGLDKDATVDSTFYWQLVKQNSFCLLNELA